MSATRKWRVGELACRSPGDAIGSHLHAKVPHRLHGRLANSFGKWQVRRHPATSGPPLPFGTSARIPSIRATHPVSDSAAICQFVWSVTRR